MEGAAVEQLHRPRLAEIVAAKLRTRIVSGEMAPGSSLPRQQDLMAEFGIGKPAMREALRILESEGLVVIRRGNQGGATVHPPAVQNAANAVGLVLQSRGVRLSDLRAALTNIEPLCSALCAARPDREETLLPELRRAHETIKASVDDEYLFTETSRQFHELMVRHCGNETLILIVGALESLWSARELAWAKHATASGGFPASAERESGIRAHERLLELIAAGDVEQVQRGARVHLEASLLYALDPESDRVVGPPLPHS